MSAVLWRCGSLAEWRSALASYTSRLSSLRPSLMELDAWIREDASRELRENRELTLTQLEKFMQWKLSRGKFRPRLQKLVSENSDASVRQSSRSAFVAADTADVKGAISALCELRGVGAATATAILSFYSADIPFMADEAMLAIPGFGVQYTLKHALRFYEHMSEKRAELAKLVEECESSSSPERKPVPLSNAELSTCLWSAAAQERISFAERPNSNRSSKKRPRNQ